MTRPLYMLGLLACIALSPSCDVAEAGYWSDGGGAGGVAVTQTAYASCGSGSAVGDLCRTTDSPITTRVWDGSGWDDCVDGWGCSDPIPTTGWAADGGAVTLATTGGLRAVMVPAGTSGGHVRSAATTSFQITALLGLLDPDTSAGGASIFFLEESATGKAVGLQLTGNSASPPTLFVVRRPSGAFNATGQTVLQTLAPTSGLEPRWWGRVAYNVGNVGTEVTLGISSDGVNFDTLLTEDKVTSFTTAPDSLQFGGEGIGVDSVTTMYLYDELPL